MAERGRPRSFDRAAALARAMEVFWAKGYEGASMTDLTAAMGIGSPSLYAAFGSKEALFREAVALYVRTDAAEMLSGFEAAATARAAFEYWLTASANGLTRPGKPSGCLIVLSMLHATEASEDVAAELRCHRGTAIAALEARLARGIADGDVPAGVDAAAMARFYVTVQQGMSIQARDGASRDTLLAIARTAMAAWDPLTAIRA